MSKGIKLCMSCMNTVASDAPRCPHCGYNGKQQNEEGSLPIGYRLSGRYVVGMRKGEDGGSLSYVGYDTILNKSVEVREFYLHGGCTRDDETLALVADGGAELLYKTSLMDFCELYKNLRKIEGQPGLIRVPDFIEANNTAYAVVDLFDGITLREFLSMAGGTVGADQAVKLLSPVINAVEAIHAVNLIHRGISPETIFVNRNGDVKLGGFATSQIRTKGTEVETKLYTGYSAPEQYATTSWQSTATDVYALAAVFYRCVSGVAPQDAEQRRGFDTVEPLAKLREDISPKLSRAVAVSMLINPEQRTQLASEFLRLLEDALANAAEEVVETSAGLAADSVQGGKQPVAEKPEENEEAKRVQRSRIIIAVSIGVVAVVLIMVFIVWPLLGLMPSGEPEDPDDPVITDELLAVPSYLEQKESTLVLDNDNFNYTYNYVYEADQKTDVVIKQSPTPGTMVKKGTTITLTINRGARVPMPGLVGKTEEAAISELDRLSIKYNITYEETTSYTPGLVIKQSTLEGTEINPETQRVTLTVAKAPPATEPDPGSSETGEGGGSGE